jgi:transposase
VGFELRDYHDYDLKLNQLILTQDKKIKEIEDNDERAQFLKTIHGIGYLTASRCLSDISNAADFKNERHLAA